MYGPARGHWLGVPKCTVGLRRPRNASEQAARRKTKEIEKETPR